MLRDIDLKYVWHPFTQMLEFAPDEDLVIVKARGSYLYDETGREYFDATSSLWVNVHGHNHARLNAAVRRQLGRLDHSTMLGISNEPAALLAERLIALVNRRSVSLPESSSQASVREIEDRPIDSQGLARGRKSKIENRLAKVFFSDNGSTAVEVALKMAFQYWRHVGATGTQRSKFVSLANGYHGDTVGSVSVGGMELFHSIFSPLLFHTYFAPSPSCYRCRTRRGSRAWRDRGVGQGLGPWGSEVGVGGVGQGPECGLECVGEMDGLLAEHGEEIAAIVVEPLVQGAGGMVVYPADVLRGYERLARKHGVLFIVDEVATGFGRCGAMFASQLAEVQPDLMTVAKGLTGGILPVAATLVSQKIYDAFLGAYGEFKTFFHGHTFTGNPLGCAAALANLDMLADPAFLPGVVERSRHMAKRLAAAGEHRNVGDVRQLGLMGGIELVKDRKTGEPLPLEQRTGHRVCLKARECGVLARPLGDVLVLMPPLASGPEDLDRMVDALEYGVDEVLGTGGTKPGPRRRRTAAQTGILGEFGAMRRVPAPFRVLVTGTDTGVGKTVVTAALACAMAEAGKPVTCLKPIESGVDNASLRGRGPCPRQGNSATATPTATATATAKATDGSYLSSFSSAASPDIPRFELAAPLSPHLAARLEGREVPFDELVDALANLPSDRVVLVEGAGGMLVPITDRLTFGDLAREACLTVLIVVPDRLGCINQTLLAVRAANDFGLDIAGVVLHRLAAAGPDPSADYNGPELKRLLGDLYLGVVGHVPDVHDASVLASAAREVAQRVWGAGGGGAPVEL